MSSKKIPINKSLISFVSSGCAVTVALIGFSPAKRSLSCTGRSPYRELRYWFRSYVRVSPSTTDQGTWLTVPVSSCPAIFALTLVPSKSEVVRGYFWPDRIRRGRSTSRHRAILRRGVVSDSDRASSSAIPNGCNRNEDSRSFVLFQTNVSRPCSMQSGVRYGRRHLGWRKQKGILNRE